MPRRPSPALVVACIALLVALTGTSYATVLNVPRNSVGTLELKRNAVKPAKIAPNAVRTAHVLDGSLLAADFRAGQIPQGPKGDKGEKGDKGDRGERGPGATSFDTTMAVGATTVLATAAGVEVVATCSTTSSVGVRTTPASNTLRVSGTGYGGTTVVPVNSAGGAGFSLLGTAPQLNVIARNAAVGAFMRVDARIVSGYPCIVWGMVTPSSSAS